MNAHNELEAQKKINNMFLKHFCLQNNEGGRIFILFPFSLCIGEYVNMLCKTGNTFK